MLEVQQVAVSYGGVRALREVSLAVPEGGIVALLGLNGAGKSTLLAAIAGLVRPERGAIRLAGRDLRGMPAHQVMRAGISLVPERRDLFPAMSVGENLAMGAFTRRDRAGIRADLDQVHSYFPVLASRTAQLAGTLSGGEQQMLAIGRALMGRPRLLLLDEPSLGLSPIMVEQIFAIIARINGEDGTTILLVEQNTRAALAIAGQGYVLETGRIIASGPSATLIDSELVRQSYLGLRPDRNAALPDENGHP